MPLETYYIDGEPYEVDVDQLSPEHKAKLVQKLKTSPDTYSKIPELPGPKKAKMEQVTTPNTIWDKIMSAGSPFGGPSVLPGIGLTANSPEQNKFQNAHLLGAGMPGGKVVQGMGALAGIDNPAELITGLVGGPMNSAMAKAVTKAPKPLLKTGLAGLLGLGQHEVNTAINNAANPSAPQSSLLQDVPGAQNTISAQIAAAALPMAGQSLSNMISKSPHARAIDIVQDATGKRTDPRDLSNLDPRGQIAPIQARVRNRIQRRMDIENRPISQMEARKLQAEQGVADIDLNLAKLDTAEQAAIKERNKIKAQIDNKIGENELRKKLAGQELKKADEARMVTDRERLTAEINRLDEENTALTQQKTNLGANVPTTGKTPVDDSKYSPRSMATIMSNRAQSIERQKELKSELVGMGKFITDTKDRLQRETVISPTLRGFASAKTSEEFLDKIRGTSVDEFQEFVNVTPPSQRAALQSAVIDDLAKLAFPNGKPDSAAISKAYPPEKIARMFGPGTAGIEAADRIKRVTESLASLEPTKLSMTEPGGLKEMANRMGVRLASYSLPGWIVFSNVTNEVAAAGAAATVALAIPAIINAAVKNRKFGDQWIEAASNGSITKGTLDAYPLVRSFLRENEVGLEDKTKMKKMLEENRNRKSPSPVQ